MASENMLTATEGLNLDQLKATPEWGALTSKQRAWVTVYLETNDAESATRSAFSCKSEENARCLRYEVLANPKVKSAVNLARGVSEQERLLEEAWTHLRQSVPGSVAAAKFLAMVVQLENLHSAGPNTLPAKSQHSDTVAESADADEPQKFPIGTTIRQDGKLYRVVAEEIP